MDSTSLPDSAVQSEKPLDVVGATDAPGQPCPLSPRKRRRRTRNVYERLLEAGRLLFADHPVDAVSIDNLVVQAGVAKGSFYNHFADKEALLSAVVEDIRQEVEQLIAEINQPVEDPARRVVRAVCVYLAVCARHPDKGRVFIRNDRIGASFSSVSSNRALLGDIAAGLAAGRFSIPTVEAGALVTYGVAHVALFRICDESQKNAIISTSQQLLQLLLRGLGLQSSEAERLSAQAVEEILRKGLADG